MPIGIQVKIVRRRRDFKTLGNKFGFIKVSDIGEWKEEEMYGMPVKFATVEQLIIDCLLHPEKCGGMEGAAKALWYAKETIDLDKLKELALKSKDVVRRRLGYLLDLLHLPALEIKGKPAGWRWLDSRNKVVKGKSEKWGLMLNLTEKELMEWQEN
jgi:predicted transcriptional regulator of viral defense system